MFCIVAGVAIFAFLWFMGMRQARRRQERLDWRLLLWRAAESRDVKKSRDARTRFCIANIGTPITLEYHGTRRTVTPLRVFIKPDYHRTYVLADENGEQKNFYIKEITYLGPEFHSGTCAFKALALCTLSALGLWGVYRCTTENDAPIRRPIPTPAKPDESGRPASSASRSLRDTAVAAPAEPEAKESATPAAQPPKTSSLPDSSFRTWTDASGAHHVDAAFVGQHGPTITLEKRDGTQVKLSVYKLSDADRAWLQEQRDTTAKKK